MHPNTILRVERVLESDSENNNELKYKNEIKVDIDYSRVSRNLLNAET